jgi:hypothetical protein
VDGGSTLWRLAGSGASTGEVTRGMGWLTQRQGDTERAEAAYAEMLELSRELKNEQNTATTLKRFHALNLLGILALNEEGDHARAPL